MNGAKKLKYHEPRFMAVDEENKQGKKMVGNNKKWHLDTTVVLAWIAVIVLTIIFWYLVVNLF